MYEICITRHFEASHGLRQLKGEYEPIHHHHWRMDVLIDAPKVDASGCVADFHEIDATIDRVIAPFCNRIFNDVPPLTITSPSTENIAHYFFGLLSKTINKDRLRVRRVTLWEEPHHSASYYE